VQAQKFFSAEKSFFGHKKRLGTSPESFAVAKPEGPAVAGSLQRGLLTTGSRCATAAEKTTLLATNLTTTFGMLSSVA
jgi:hypothetical protein